MPSKKKKKRTPNFFFFSFVSSQLTRYCKILTLGILWNSWPFWSVFCALWGGANGHCRTSVVQASISVQHHDGLWRPLTNVSVPRLVPIYHRLSLTITILHWISHICPITFLITIVYRIVNTQCAIIILIGGNGMLFWRSRTVYHLVFRSLAKWGKNFNMEKYKEQKTPPEIPATVNLII